jgi:hypothetical protein
LGFFAVPRFRDSTRQRIAKYRGSRGSRKKTESALKNEKKNGKKNIIFAKIDFFFRDPREYHGSARLAILSRFLGGIAKSSTRVQKTQEPQKYRG